MMQLSQLIGQDVIIHWRDSDSSTRVGLRAVEAFGIIYYDQAQNGTSFVPWSSILEITLY